jgi:two-component system sensor histidine kinase KdpD
VTTRADTVEGSSTSLKRGTLRIYLGAAPGVGKTFAMLAEGQRRRARGRDVVVGVVETHDRPRTLEQLEGLEVIARRAIPYRGITLHEMDVDAIIRRRPDVVLVDEFAHSNAPGQRNAKRWQDVNDILEAGIDVISTVNVQHLESLNDVVERITGIVQRETVPDDAVRAADQIELVDMSPEALRRRLAHGNVYAADKIDAALGNYFRQGNLTALRELALLWVADRVDDSMDEYRRRHDISRAWETRERVVVAVSGAQNGEKLIRRAARLAQRTKGDLIGVHVHSATGLAGGSDDDDDVLAARRKLLGELGGDLREVTSNDVAAGLVQVARSENATQIVLGASTRSRWHELVNGSVVNRVVKLSGDIDVHVISDRDPDSDRAAGDEDHRRLPKVRAVLTPLSPTRRLWGWVLAAAGLPLLTLLFAHSRDTFSLPSILLLYLVLAMVVALVGGVMPSAVAVVAGFMLANWYFTEPQYEFSVAETENLLALAVYVAAAGIVAVLVDRIGRRTLQLRRATAEASAMASLAGGLAAGAGPEPALTELLGTLRATFGFRAASLLRDLGTDGWAVEAQSGLQPPSTPAAADAVCEVGTDGVLALAGGSLSADDQRVLQALAAQLALAAEARRLHGEASRAGALEAANELRTALLQAVSHDLRTPLASIKASISSLRQRDIEWTAGEIDEFQATIEEETDRLSALVGNLLDMSRLQADVVAVSLRPTGVDEVALAAVASLGPLGREVVIDVPETLPDVSADAALLERALANLLSNAVRLSPPGVPPRITAGAVLDRVDIRVIDHGRGIEPANRDVVFQPFQRLGDHGGSGVGLGLAITKGFIEAIGGELAIDDTPGGGATMVVSLRQWRP